jgi:serine/threonine protein kinase
MGRYTGLQADLFAIGVILFYMYTGSPPFTSTKNTDPIYKFICQKKYDKFWSIHTQSHPPFQTKPKSEPQTPPTPLTQPQ